MEQQHEVMKSLAEIDRLRDEIRGMEEQIGQLGDRVDKCGGNDEAYRQIGAQDRQAAGLRQTLTKQIAALRVAAPEALQAWVERNRETLRQQVMAELAKTRPDAKTIDEGLRCITLDAKFSNSDLVVLRLAGFLDEWRDLLAGSRPYVLNPPSWETYPKLPSTCFQLSKPLPPGPGLASRHTDIINISTWASWHNVLIFLAETLSILDFGKPCRIEHQLAAINEDFPWECSWKLTTGQLSLSLSWGTARPAGYEPGDATPADSCLEPFRRFSVSGLLPTEKIIWDGRFMEETTKGKVPPLSIEFLGLREDRVAAIETLAHLLYASVNRTSAKPK